MTVSGHCAMLPDHNPLVCQPPPPQALIDACAGKSAGDSCTVTVDGRVLTGACATAHDGVTLACMPPRPPEQSARVAACLGMAAGTLCTVHHEDETRNGVCRLNDEGVLACLPPAPPQETVDACAGKAVGDTCSFSWMENHTVSGSCRPSPDSTTLVCAPLCPPRWMMEVLLRTFSRR